jgi:hypothetical protein
VPRNDANFGIGTLKAVPVELDAGKLLATEGLGVGISEDQRTDAAYLHRLRMRCEWP